MRNVVPAKKPKEITEFSIIIPTAGSGRRMKSYGAKGLIQLSTDSNIINRQIRLSKERFPACEIVLVTGFQSDKVLKSLAYDVKSVENHCFEETSVLYSIGLALRVVSHHNVLIIYGDLVFEPQVIDLNFRESAMVTGPMQEDCVGVNIDNGEICHFEYGLPNKWCQIAFISDDHFQSFKKIATNRDNSKLHTFEIFNKMLNNGCNFKNLPCKGKLVEIENVSDIDVGRVIK